MKYNKKYLYSGVSWKEAVVTTLISFSVSFPGFLLYEVIWGDLLKDIFDPKNQYPFSVINIILTVGLFTALGISSLVVLLVYRQYSLKSKVLTIAVCIVLTLSFLFALSFVSMFFLFPSLKIHQILGFSVFYFALFSIYVLPSPVWFWFIALIAFHVALVFFAKIFYTIKLPKINKRRKKPVYQSKVL